MCWVGVGSWDSARCKHAGHAGAAGPGTGQQGACLSSSLGTHVADNCSGLLLLSKKLADARRRLSSPLVLETETNKQKHVLLLTP